MIKQLSVFVENQAGQPDAGDIGADGGTYQYQGDRFI